MRSSAACEAPVARAYGATPVARLTLNGPSTRIRVKLVMPKLRVAPFAGAANAMRAAAMRKVRIRPPSYANFKAGLRAVDVARARAADAALGAAGKVDVARAHEADLGRAAG